MGSVVQWLRHLADRAWSEEAIPKDWKKSLVVPLHKKGTRMSVTTTVAFHCKVSPANPSSVGPFLTASSHVLSSN